MAVVPQTIAHYRILGKLGAGGMGEVYLAEDLRLGRKLALKLLPERFTDDAERVRRFEQEARAVSALNHPNILTLYEIGEADGLHFMATEFVEGRTLRQQIEVARPKWPEAVEIVAQVATALAVAHASGLTHRDIKPENIMLRPDGYVKILDFGLAKLTERGSFGEAANETEAGVILGTVTYMSPEQARGLKVDARSDLFSLGVVLYEAIAGEPPFGGETKSDVVAAILQKEPMPLERFAADLPRELDLTVSKMLAKDRAHRYQAASELLADLKRLKAKLLAETGEVGRTTKREAAPRPRRARRQIDTLAVMPFVNAGQEANTAYLSDGITESLINSLSRLPKLRVMARSTVFAYQGRPQDPRQIGRELGVRAVLTGRVLQVSDRLVVKTELVDTGDGAQLWGEQYNRPLSDIFAIEEEISREISEKLRLRLSGEEKRRLARRHTENPEAYQAYLKGRYYWNQRTGRSLKKAIEYFKQAIALDANYALAYAGLADTYCLLGIYSALPPLTIMPQAKAAAERALALDETLAEAHTALAGARAFFDWDWEGAGREFRRAIELNPAQALARHWYASVYLTAMGRFDEALAEERRAWELEPLSLVINTHLGWICYQARRYDEAVQYFQQAMEIGPEFVPAHFYLGLTRAQQGQFDEASEALERALELSQGGAMIIGALGFVRALAGREDEARCALAKLDQAAAEKYVSPFYYALVQTGLRAHDEAFARLEEAYAERFGWLAWLKTEPMFDHLRNDARYTNLLKRLRLAP